MATDAGNVGLFCDFAGTLVKMDDTRQLPIDARGNIRIELLPRRKTTLFPLKNHLIFVVTNQAGSQTRTLHPGAGRNRDGRTRSATRRYSHRMANLPA